MNMACQNKTWVKDYHCNMLKLVNMDLLLFIWFYIYCYGIF
jgi:hypothetical protein